MELTEKKEFDLLSLGEIMLRLSRPTMSVLPEATASASRQEAQN